MVKKATMDEARFTIFSAEVRVRAPITMPDVTAKRVADELSELTDFLDDAARTFLNARRTEWRRFNLTLTVR